MRNPQTLEDITPAMRAALLRIGAPATGNTNARHIRRNDPTHGGIHTLTIKALIRHGYIEPGHDKFRRDVWKLSAAGWALVTAHTPRYLTPAARPAHTERGYTTEPHQAMRDEPEAIDRATQDRYSKEALEKPRITQRQVLLEQLDIIESALVAIAHADVDRSVSKDVAAMRCRRDAILRKLAA